MKLTDQQLKELAMATYEAILRKQQKEEEKKHG